MDYLWPWLQVRFGSLVPLSSIRVRLPGELLGGGSILMIVCGVILDFIVGELVTSCSIFAWTSSALSEAH